MPLTENILVVLPPPPHTHKHTHTSLYTNKQRKLHGSRISLLPHTLLPTFVVPTLASQASDPRKPSTHFYTPTVLLAGWLLACDTALLTSRYTTKLSTDQRTNDNDDDGAEQSSHSSTPSIHPSNQPARQLAQQHHGLLCLAVPAMKGTNRCASWMAAYLPGWLAGSTSHVVTYSEEISCERINSNSNGNYNNNNGERTTTNDRLCRADVQHSLCENSNAHIHTVRTNDDDDNNGNNNNEQAFLLLNVEMCRCVCVRV